MSAYVHWHNRLSLEQLGRRARSMPLFVALIPFVAGVVLADNYYFPMWLVVVSWSLTIIMSWLLIESRTALLYITAALTMTGYIVAELRAPCTNIPYDRVLEMIIEVRGVPAVRDGYRVAEGRVVSWADDGEWRSANDRVQIWLRCDSVSEGARVTVASTLVERMSRYEGYNELLRRRGYVGGVSIANYNIIDVEPYDRLTLQHRALNKLSCYVADSVSHATVEAMVVGSRANIPRRVSDDYSHTGMAHLMAVSGLHLGVVALVANMLLLPLVYIHRGHRLRNLLVIALLWLFVAVSGASPSVVRAAMMLSVLQLSYFLSAQYNSLNAMGFAIFAMILYRPDYIFDISFQLSVAAVLGIVVWAVPAIRSLRVYQLSRWVCSTLIIGVAATLWTLPIISHTFGNIPLVGVIVTPIALFTAYIIVGGGVLALMLPQSVATLFVAVGEWAAGIQNMIVHGASLLRYASVEYTLPLSGVVACYVVYAVITIVVMSVRREKKIIIPEYEYDDTGRL